MYACDAIAGENSTHEPDLRPNRALHLNVVDPTLTGANGMIIAPVSPCSRRLRWNAKRWDILGWSESLV